MAPYKGNWFAGSRAKVSVAIGMQPLSVMGEELSGQLSLGTWPDGLEELDVLGQLFVSSQR